MSISADFAQLAANPGTARTRAVISSSVSDTSCNRAGRSSIAASPSHRGYADKSSDTQIPRYHPPRPGAHPALVPRAPPSPVLTAGYVSGFVRRDAGSTDRRVCVTPMSAIRSDTLASDAAESAVQSLHLTLRCKGVRFDGVRTEREQEKLRRYAES